MSDRYTKLHYSEQNHRGAPAICGTGGWGVCTTTNPLGVSCIRCRAKIQPLIRAEAAKRVEEQRARELENTQRAASARARHEEDMSLLRNALGAYVSERPEHRAVADRIIKRAGMWLPV